MHERPMPLEFYSPLRDELFAFIREKRACGHRYESETAALRRFDLFLHKQGLAARELPQTLVERWLARQPHDSPKTHLSRLWLTRQFALFLHERGLPVFIPRTDNAPIMRLDFTPHIFTHQEMQQILSAATNLPAEQRSPLRHLIMPEIFHLLYGCGLRVGEVLRLKVKDVNLATGVLTIREGKFRKDRLVPLATSMTARLRRYSNLMGERSAEAFFFPAPDGGKYSSQVVYVCFRRFLREAGISHGGRGKGPRLHDLRHTYAVHRLQQWYHDGAELNAKLPVLSTYLGHQSLVGTQRYLRLTPEIFPDIQARLEQVFGAVIPRRVPS